jgi:hypothetical protein
VTTSIAWRAAPIVILLPWAAGCGPRLTREERIELLRSQYTASLESLTVEQEPVEGGAAVGSESGAGESAPPRVRTDAVLDILVSSAGEARLPGLTLDIEHLDAERRAKDRSTLWVETASLAPGQSTQVTHTLDNVAWETGDAYTVEVRKSIPAAQRSLYREFDGGAQ